MPTSLRPRRLVAAAAVLSLVALPALLALAGNGRKPNQVDPSKIDFGGPVRDVHIDGGFSANGRWAVGIVEVDIGDGDTRGQVVLLDVKKNRLRLITRRASDGGASEGSSFGPSISADGRQIVFQSRATDIATDGTIDENGQGDIFLHDVAAGTTRVLSKSAGTNRTADDFTFSPGFVPGGTHVVFSGAAKDLVTDGPAPSPTGRENNVFLHELATGRTTLISVNAAGTSGGNARSSVDAFGPPIRPFSADGRYLLFRSSASDLVEGSGDVEGASSDVFLRDLELGVTEIVSVTNDGQAFGRDQLYQPFPLGISADGRHVFFSSRSPEVTDRDSAPRSDVFVRDRVAGTTTRVSGSVSGGLANGTSTWAAMTPDGRRALFTSDATDLGFDVVSPGGEGGRHLYLYEIEEDRVTLLSHRRKDPATSSDRGLFGAGISDDGRVVTFASDATDLVKKKVGNGTEIYLYDIKKRRARRLTKFGKQIGPGFFSDAHRPNLDPRGRRIVFRFARYSIVDDDFEEADRVLILRAR